MYRAFTVNGLVTRPDLKNIQPKVVWGCWLTIFHWVTLPFDVFILVCQSSGAKIFLYIYRYISIAWWICMQCTAFIHSDSISLIFIWNGRREDTTIPSESSLTEKPRLLTFITYIIVDYHQLPLWILYSSRLEHCLILFKMHLHKHEYSNYWIFPNYIWHNLIHQLHYTFKLAF